MINSSVSVNLDLRKKLGGKGDFKLRQDNSDMVIVLVLPNKIQPSPSILIQTTDQVKVCIFLQWINS